MSNNITEARSLEFTTMVDDLLQQKGSRLREAVEEGSHTGKQAVPVDQIGLVTAVKKAGRHADLPTIEVPHARRWVTPQTYQFRDFIDRPDTLRMLWDPKSRYARAFANALGRAMDDEIITAMNATSTTGETGSGTEAFASAQSIGTVTDGMTVTKLRQAAELFRANEVEVDDETMYCVMASDQIEDLMNETQVVSIDYNTNRVLVDGRLTSFMGFNFIHSERLGLNGADRAVLCWAKSGVHLGMWEDIKTPIDWLPEKQAWQVAGIGDFGATRLELEKVIELPCSE